MTGEPVDDGACFACGIENAHSLRWSFVAVEGGGARGTVTLEPYLQGYAGIAHGGIVMLLLDEIMAHAAGHAGDKVMTAAVNVRFRASVPLGVPLEVTGRVQSRRGKILKIAGEIRNGGGLLLAVAEGSFVSLGPLEPGRFGNSGAVRPV